MDQHPAAAFSCAGAAAGNAERIRQLAEDHEALEGARQQVWLEEYEQRERRARRRSSLRQSRSGSSRRTVGTTPSQLVSTPSVARSSARGEGPGGRGAAVTLAEEPPAAGEGRASSPRGSGTYPYSLPNGAFAGNPPARGAFAGNPPARSGLPEKETTAPKGAAAACPALAAAGPAVEDYGATRRGP